MTPEAAEARPDDPSRSWRWIAERVRAWDERGHVVPWHLTNVWARLIRERLAICFGSRPDSVPSSSSRVASRTTLGATADDHTGAFERPARPMIQPSLRSHTRAASMARRSPGSTTRCVLTRFSRSLPVERASTLPVCPTNQHAATRARATRTLHRVGCWISSATPSASPT